MKCIVKVSKQFGKLLDTVERVPDDEAQALVNTGDYAYCPKRVWKVKDRQ